MCDKQAVTDENLADRVYYWELRLGIPLSASSDPVARLDYLIEALRPSPVNRAAMWQMSLTNKALKKRNKELEQRWTQLRKLLGIENRHEDTW